MQLSDFAGAFCARNDDVIWPHRYPGDGRPKGGHKLIMFRAAGVSVEVGNPATGLWLQTGTDRAVRRYRKRFAWLATAADAILLTPACSSLK
jgi:hypothetical protein